jgi:hypothetical protein
VAALVQNGVVFLVKPVYPVVRGSIAVELLPEEENTEAKAAVLKREAKYTAEQAERVKMWRLSSTERREEVIVSAARMWPVTWVRLEADDGATVWLTLEVADEAMWEEQDRQRAIAEDPDTPADLVIEGNDAPEEMYVEGRAAVRWDQPMVGSLLGRVDCGWVFRAHVQVSDRTGL